MLSFPFDPYPELETERLFLKRIGLEDEEPFYRLRASKEVMQYIGRPLAKKPEDARELILSKNGVIDARDGYVWALHRREEPGLIGTICLWQFNRQSARAEIGYLLDPRFQGKGMMKEALDAVVSFGFGTMELHSIEAQVNPDNQASIRLLERAGFLREGYFRENFFYDGKYSDTAVYSLLTPIKQ